MSVRNLPLSGLVVCSLCAVSLGDVLVAWGNDVNGCLGDGAAGGSRAAAAPVLNLGRVVGSASGRFAGGGGSAMALQGGAAYRWGIVQVDEENFAPDPTPDVVAGLESGVTLVAVSNDYFDGYAVKDNDLYRFYPGNLATPFGLIGGNITALEAGVTVLLIRDGALWSLGMNLYGMLGDGSSVSSRWTAQPVPGFDSGVTDIVVGDWECGAIKDGAVYTWGRNFAGSQGAAIADTNVERHTPGPVVGLDGGVTALAGGRHFFLAVRDGLVYSWGYNSAGQLGYAGSGYTTAPAQVPGLQGIVEVAAFGASSFALSADGRLWSWGMSDHLNLGWSGGGSTPHLVTPPAGYKFTGVRAGAGFTLATIAPVCAADFGGVGGAASPDGQLDNNDFVVFIDAFFAQDPMADIGSTGAAPHPDGAFDNNDFIVFVDRFFSGC